MDTQSSINLKTVFVFTEDTRVQPIQVCPRDYGFDTDEEEIARGMLAPLPASLSSQAIFQTGLDTFDFDNLWFLS